MSTKKALEQIFNKLNGTTKWQLNFFIEIFDLIYSIQGRFNFQNLTRYSKLNESTFRRNFQKFFDWLDFNLELIKLAGVDLKDEVIAAFDCSFITKSVKKTYDIDRFWSGCMNGLEISMVCLIEVKTRKAWINTMSKITKSPPPLFNTPVKQQRYESTMDIWGNLADVKHAMFQHSVFCQTYLPYRNPGDDITYWQHEQSNASLAIQSL